MKTMKLSRETSRPAEVKDMHRELQIQFPLPRRINQTIDNNLKLIHQLLERQEATQAQ